MPRSQHSEELLLVVISHWSSRLLLTTVLCGKPSSSTYLMRWMQSVASCAAGVSYRLFGKLPVSEMPAFDWKVLIDELVSKAPILLQILCTLTSSSDPRNKHKSGSVHHPGICMAASVILKERNREMCGVQAMISLLLFESHANR